MSETFDQKTERNIRVQLRYDELMAAGKHGHYETMFRVVREEVEPLMADAARLKYIIDRWLAIDDYDFLPDAAVHAAHAEGFKAAIDEAISKEQSAS